MFTGIIRSLGEITSIIREPEAQSMTIRADISGDLKEGDSVAVDGVCLTVLSHTQTDWSLRLMHETLQRTNLGGVGVGDVVNLERPMRAGERLDGHFVLGHVDGVAEITAIAAVGGDKIFTFRPPAQLMPHFISKGSVALNGVSLTVVTVSDKAFTVSMMPYTLAHTSFGQAAVGARVNIEVDVLGKYVESFLQKRFESSNITTYHRAHA